MLETKNSKHWLEITPKGIKKSKKSFKEKLAELKKNLCQLRYLTMYHKKKQGFGTALGSLWLILDPLLHALLYYFLVKIIFCSSDANRFVTIATVLTFWRLHAKILAQSATLFTDKATLIKNSNFPLHLIIYEFAYVHLFFFLYNIVTLLILLASNGIFPKFQWIAIIPVFLAQYAFSLCIALFLSIMGTFFRDIKRVIFFPISLWWYLSPGIYELERLPQKYLHYFLINPFAHILPAYKDIIIRSKPPENMLTICLILGFSFLSIFILFKLLKKARYYFFLFI